MAELETPLATIPTDIGAKAANGITLYTLLAAHKVGIERAAEGVLHKNDATAAPTTGDDTADGYSVGSFWFDVTNDDAYVCLDASAGAAVWAQIDNTPARLHKYDATAAPTVGDDTADGYAVGSFWCDVTNDQAYVCLDASAGAAVWRRIDYNGPLYKLDANAAPVASNDETEGYGPGSLWLDLVTTYGLYICADASEGAATWGRIDSWGAQYTANASAPTPGASGFTKGYIWIHTAEGITYLNTGTDSSATWVALNNLPHSKLDATEAPDADNDIDEGYYPGSIWVDVSANKAYVCAENLDGGAVWKEVGAGGSNWLTANPAVLTVERVDTGDIGAGVEVVRVYGDEVLAFDGAVDAFRDQDLAVSGGSTDRVRVFDTTTFGGGVALWLKVADGTIGGDFGSGASDRLLRTEHGRAIRVVNFNGETLTGPAFYALTFHSASDEFRVGNGPDTALSYETDDVVAFGYASDAV